MIDEKKQRFIRDSLLIEAGQDASYGFMESRTNSDDLSYGDHVAETRIPESNPFKKKIDEAKAKKTKRQELKEKKETTIKALLTF